MYHVEAAVLADVQPLTRYLELAVFDRSNIMTSKLGSIPDGKLTWCNFGFII
jgi:hypothetical protein